MAKQLGVRHGAYLSALGFSIFSQEKKTEKEKKNPAFPHYFQLRPKTRALGKSRTHVDFIFLILYHDFDDFPFNYH
jgi:hypothetical protein